MLAALRAVAPCDLRTTPAIGIDAFRTHGADREPESRQDALSFVAGSVYSGVIFTLDTQRGNITELCLGAAAE